MRFPSTHWSVLARATLDSQSGARDALEELCRRYWTPLHQFIRLRGYNETDAQDLAQDFLLHVLEHSTLRTADRQKGLFRSFLLGALTRFLGDEYDRRHAQKRGQGATHVSMDGMNDAEVPSAAAVDSSFFDREWALAILESAQRQTREEFERNGGRDRFAVLRRFLPGALESLTYEQAAADLAMSVPALTSEVHRLRQRFKAVLREEVGRTVSSPHELTEEMAYLRTVLMHRGNDLDPETKDSPPDS